MYFLSDKKGFCVSMTDGGLLFMDCSSVDESEDWVRCLNAVLFARNVNGGMCVCYVSVSSVGHYSVVDT